MGKSALEIAEYFGIEEKRAYQIRNILYKRNGNSPEFFVPDIEPLSIGELFAIDNRPKPWQIMQQINNLLNANGVQSIGNNPMGNDSLIDYIDMSDVFKPTICLFKPCPNFHIFIYCTLDDIVRFALENGYNLPGVL